METEKQPKETDAVREKLESYGALQRRIDNENQRLKMFEAAMYAPSTQTLTGMPSGGGDGTSKTERLILKKEELTKKIEKMEREERQLLDDLDAMIDQLKKPDEQMVIEMRYIDCSRWWTICAALYFSEPDYDENPDKYLKRTFKLHGSALQTLARIYGSTTG